MVPCAGLGFEELHAFLRVCVCFFRDETALQLLEVIIHHGEIKPLGGWQVVALATRTFERLGHSMSTHTPLSHGTLNPDCPIHMRSQVQIQLEFDPD